MPRRTPVVVDGPRGPVDRAGTDPEQAANALVEARARVAVPKKKGDVVYEAIAASYLVLVQQPIVINHENGYKEFKRGKSARFRDFEFRTNDPEIIEHLDNHRDFGIGKDFWRAEEARQLTLESAVNSLAATVKAVSDPEVARRLIAELAPLAGADFKLPEPRKAQAPVADTPNSAPTE